MSKQSDTKFNQGYEAKPIFPMCSNCEHFKSDKKTLPPFGYIEEKNLHCEIGGFVVKKQATCNYHTKKIEK